jgi:hypothetical protein
MMSMNIDHRSIIMLHYCQFVIYTTIYLTKPRNRCAQGSSAVENQEIIQNDETLVDATA